MNRKVAFCIARDGVPQSGFVRYQARSLGATPRPYSSLSDGQKLGYDDENMANLRPFGIIAAVSQNNVIGINGDLPWRVPADRKAFENITRKKTLIIGRKTLLEGGAGSFDHVSHCRRVVVVSQTFQEEEVKRLTSGPAPSSSRKFPSFHVAASLQEAIRVAQNLGSSSAYKKDALSTANCLKDVECWVGGGESIYGEALGLPQARFLHLTVMNVHVPIVSDTTNVARFPHRQIWESNYKLIEKVEHSACDPISFLTSVYERIIPNEEAVL